MVAIVFFVYFIKNLKSFSKNTIIKIISFTIILGIIIPIYMQTDEFKIFYQRTFETKSATEGRIGNYDVVFGSEIDSNALIFGRGILKIEDYIPSFPRIFYYYGIIGMTMFVIISIRNFIMLKSIQWVTWLILFILMFPTEMFFGNFILLYIPFMQNPLKLSEESTI